ncbi:hypothetical protein CH352_18070 [Leptospira hartskeerlii]|uniref:Uncharacterized protein n=1 Tax=Leptospira hartskeerlii TaxID=2023177 RepID=A0A2M9X8N8_9LEPT|nr:hypothetical protein [Leptospira hartskeerlii]PJZ24063.1 hypothetical protein CH357_18220 [Leptospira hartskeerlii]PJZ32129.1 hypothetical protein CH352_18070 [Leptospira hartskeerlii]
MELSPKNKLRLHRYLGIVSLSFLFSRPFVILFQFPDIQNFEYFSATIGRAGAVFGVLAFITGGGLGKYLDEKKARVAEIHTILMLAGLTMQVPVLAEVKILLIPNLISYFGCVILICGWILGRRVFINRKRILPF